MFQRMTNRNSALTTFLVACMLPVLAGLLVTVPPVAIILVVVGIVINRQRAGTRKAREAELLARHRATWGF